MRDLSTDIQESWSELDGLWEIFREFLKAARSADKASIQLDDTEGQESLSFEDLSRRFAQCKDVVDTVVSSGSFDSIPVRSAKRIHAMIDEARAQIIDANAKFSGMPNAGGIGKIDKSQLTLASADEVVKIDLGAVYRAIFERFDAIVYEFGIISHFVKVEGLTSFYFRKQEVDRIVAQTEREAQKVSTTREDLLENRKLQAELITQFKSDLDFIETAKNQVDEVVDTLSQQQAALTQKIAATDASLNTVHPIIENANKLRAEIDVYDTFLAEHRSKLGALQDKMIAHEEALIQTKAEIRNNEQKIRGQIEDAEKMLKGATIAGLAGEFGSIKDELEKKLEDAKNAVNLSTILLLLSVSPILIYVFGPALGLEVNGTSFGDGSWAQYLTSLGMRSVLLIPAMWFARFSAKRYDRIFKLKEHYAYKYSLATAVEGFKKQAPSYEDDIAAETFFELTFNPADRLDRPTKARTERRESLVVKAIRDRLAKRSETQPDEAKVS